MRSYRTKLDFQATYEALNDNGPKNWSIGLNHKGHVSLRIPEFPEILVQITTGGFVKIINGSKKLDDQILSLVGPYVRMRDSLPFRAELNKEVTGEKVLREDLETFVRVTGIYDQMASEGVISPWESRVRPGINTLIMKEEPGTTICSVWPLGHAYSGFTTVNNAPTGAVLAGSVQDLIFAVNIPGTIFSSSSMRSPDGISSGPKGSGLDTLAIYFPPGFKVPAVVTNWVQHEPVEEQPVSVTMASGHPQVRVLKSSSRDRYFPGSRIVCIIAEAPIRRGPDITQSFLNVSGSDKKSCYVRVKRVTAPSVAGKYFFKIALLTSGLLPKGLNENNAPMPVEYIPQFIPVGAWPLLLVNGEVEPSTITGTIRYGGADQTRYGQPIVEAAKVCAHMTMRIDPYTGSDRSDLPTIDAQAYVNATAKGHYEMDGVAPGVYTLRVSAAGYPTRCVTGVRILKGGSFHSDCYLQPGPVIHGTVLSKYGSCDHPWRETALVKIELYNSPTRSHVPDPSAGSPVSWSPDVVRPEAKLLDGANQLDQSFPSLGRAEADFDISTSRSDEVNTSNETRGPQDVGPAQDWTVKGGTLLPFHFEFGVKDRFGAPRDLDGMIPQVHATWVNGLTPGCYYTRAWIPGYKQSTADGADFLEYFFWVEPNSRTREVERTIALRQAE